MLLRASRNIPLNSALDALCISAARGENSVIFRPATGYLRSAEEWGFQRH